MTDLAPSHGPLAGVRVLEVGGIGPVPQAAKQLREMGAEVLRIEAPTNVPPTASALLHQGRPTATLDLRARAGLDVLLELVANADVLLEGHRPGVAERLGFGPLECTSRNSRLIYARLTGWGQTGPLAHKAGHDINYIAVAGALGLMGDADRPPAPPVNLVGDFGGGAMFAVTGILGALVERHGSGRGQVLDIAMVDGVASLLSMFLGWRREGEWSGRRQDNLIDGGAPFYGTYRTSDDRFVAVGAIEPKFYRDLVCLLGLEHHDDLPDQYDRSRWPEMRALFADLFNSRTRDEWVAMAAGLDACLSPVLHLDELGEHEHLSCRGTYEVTSEGLMSAPAPRFERTSLIPQSSTPASPDDARRLAAAWGLDATRAALLAGAAPA